ncbi:FHA domain-containing protein [Marine Group I thaumarchaeote]|uniref:FHA domain-containing protein n=1 Tax=Marine Group I thaumarchaeote TaxID=2511932 RepID=A0A7K4NMZ0_9ARCH|nr:FHA domain-containing protein [Marine Group I thaumarchaeote]
MTEQCPMCGKERADGQDYCLTSGCGWHFASDIVVDPQSEHSYIQSEEKWEENKKEMQKEQEPPKSEPEFFKERDEKASDSFIQSNSEWEKDRKQMEAESESTVSGYNAQVVDVNESKGILVLPGGKEIPVEDNPITVGRNDVSEYVEFKIGKNPNEVSSQQFTIFRLPSESTRLNEGYDYFIEDRITSVQNKPSTNHTKVNGEDITGQLKKELHDGDKIEFAHMEECVATFQFR